MDCLLCLQCVHGCPGPFPPSPSPAGPRRPKRAPGQPHLSAVLLARQRGGPAAPSQRAGQQRAEGGQSGGAALSPGGGHRAATEGQWSLLNPALIYRHSVYLFFVQNRVAVALQLLNPNASNSGTLSASTNSALSPTKQPFGAASQNNSSGGVELPPRILVVTQQGGMLIVDVEGFQVRSTGFFSIKVR